MNDLDNTPAETTLSSEIIVQDGMAFSVIYENGLFHKILVRGDLFDRFTDGGKEAAVKYLAINHKIGHLLASDLLHGWYRDEARCIYKF